MKCYFVVGILVLACGTENNVYYVSNDGGKQADANAPEAIMTDDAKMIVDVVVVIDAGSDVPTDGPTVDDGWTLPMVGVNCDGICWSRPWMTKLGMCEGQCQGICIGTCNGTKSNDSCNGYCVGECTATCLGTCYWWCECSSNATPSCNTEP